MNSALQEILDQITSTEDAAKKLDGIRQYLSNTELKDMTRAEINTRIKRLEAIVDEATLCGERLWQYYASASRAGETKD
jgi:oligoendopeptidase F